MKVSTEPDLPSTLLHTAVGTASFLGIGRYGASFDRKRKQLFSFFLLRRMKNKKAFSLLQLSIY